MVSQTRTGIDDCRDELSRIEDEVRVRLEPLSEAQFNWRPGAGRWSAAEGLEHLAITTTLMLGQVRPALERAKLRGKTGEGSCR